MRKKVHLFHICSDASSKDGGTQSGAEKFESSKHITNNADSSLDESSKICLARHPGRLLLIKVRIKAIKTND